MGTIKLVKLKISGFRSFLNESVIYFPQNGMVCIHGTDIRTGGSNGSGKSSILEAIYWILGINTLPTTELKNYNSNSINGELTLNIGGDEWCIYRSTNKLSLLVNNQPVEGLKNVILDKINKKIGDSEIFEILSYRRQSDFGKFFYTQDSKLKEFFSKCLPELDKIDAVYNLSVKKKNDLESSLILKENNLNILQSQLVQLKNIQSLDIKDLLLKKESLLKDREKFSLKESSFTREENEELLRLNFEINELNKKLNELSNKLSNEESLELNDSEILELKKSIEEKKREIEILKLNDPSELINSQIEILNQKLMSVNSMENEKKTKELKVLNILSKVKDFIQKINILKENKCPTCLRVWEESQLKLKEIEVEKCNHIKQLESLEKEVNSYPNFSVQKSELNENIKALNNQLSLYKESLSKKNFELNSFKTRLFDLSQAKINSTKIEILHITQKISLLKNKIYEINLNSKKRISYEISNIELKISNIDDQVNKYNQVQSTIDDLEKKIADLTEEIYDIKHKIKLESEICKILGKRGVPGLYFDNLVYEIENISNEMISQIPNSSDISIKMETSLETKSGTTKNQINVKLFKSANEISFRSLSGGQKAALSLCVDLSMIRALKRRTNIKSGWIALDEAMDGMDIASKEAMLSLIRSEMSDLLILMIDHATEIKELFDSIINIEYDGNTSRVIHEK